MSTFTGARRRNRRDGFRPRLETLEAKDCPSATLNGTTLKIEGGSGQNNVVVTVDEQADKIFVTENSGTKDFKSSKVTRIVVDLKDGGDTFTFNLGGALDFLRAKSIDLDLGGGNDTANFDVAQDGLGGAAEINANLTIAVAGKGGADNLNVSLGSAESANVEVTSDLGQGNDSATMSLLGDLVAGNVTLNFLASNNDGVEDGHDDFQVNAQSVDVDAASALNVDMAGGRGEDILDTLYSGSLDGLLRVRSNGGKSQDTVTAGIALDSESDGRLDAIIRGGEHNNDTVLLTLLNDSDSVTIINAQQLQN